MIFGIFCALLIIEFAVISIAMDISRIAKILKEIKEIKKLLREGTNHETT